MWTTPNWMTLPLGPQATMIKSVAAVCLVAALFWGASQAATFDGVDVPAMLKNETAVAAYVKCILEATECNESAKRLLCESCRPSAGRKYLYDVRL